MAMLAAPRRKQKFSVDPRGSSWSKDDNKFGQKLLEKMGWSKGRGLGANEDGRVEHVKITHKDDTRGVGCSKSQADNWIAHQDDFNSLLANLNQNYTCDEDKPVVNVDKIQCLEEKSRASKGRVHYQKFTKGKDLSSRKLEDLDCIFGRRKKRKTSKEDGTTDVDHASTQALVDEDNHVGGQTFASKDSVQGYFARKMAKKDSSKMMDLANIKEDESSSFSSEAEDKNNKTQPTPDYGIKTFSSSQSVADYFAQKMAMLRNGKNTLYAKEDNSDTMERESDSAILSVFSNLIGAEDQEECLSRRPKKKKQKKRKHELCEVESDENKVKADRECGEPHIKKKKKQKMVETEAEIQQDFFVGESDEAQETRKRRKGKKTRDLVTDSSVKESYTEIANENKELSACTMNLNKPHADTPNRKRVHFRDPVISSSFNIGENTNPQTNNCESGPVVETNSTVSEIKVVAAEPASAKGNLPNMENDQCGSVVEKAVRSKKKKKSKKNGKEKTLEESLGGASCEIKSDDCIVTKGTVCSSQSSVVKGSNPQNNTPSKKKKRKPDLTEQEKKTPSKPDSAKSLSDMDSKTRKLVNKKKKDLSKRKTSANVKPNFVGSNIDKIPGYSSSNLLLMA